MAERGSNFTNVIAGAALTLGLISAGINGSLFLTGNTYTDRAANTSPSQKLGTGSYMTYVDAVCTNTGGLAKYTACSIANPFTGTAAVLNFLVDSNKAPNASSVTCTNTTPGSTTQTGTHILIRYAATASGYTVRMSGSTVRVPVIPPNGNLRCWHSTTPGVGLKQQMRAWLAEQYVP